MSWSSWVTLENEYRETGRMLKDARGKLEVNTTRDAVDKELLGGMMSDVGEMSKILKHKIFYEFNSLSEDELALLTDRQREIAELRQRYSYTEIAKITGLRPDEVFRIFKQAVNKVKKAKRQQAKGIPVGLSPQQEKIYILYKQGKKPKEIALMLNTSYSNVRYQLSMIKKKSVSKTIQ